jgi:hypothetical protein
MLTKPAAAVAALLGAFGVAMVSLAAGASLDFASVALAAGTSAGSSPGAAALAVALVSEAARCAGWDTTAAVSVSVCTPVCYARASTGLAGWKAVGSNDSCNPKLGACVAVADSRLHASDSEMNRQEQVPVGIW